MKARLSQYLLVSMLLWVGVVQAGTYTSASATYSWIDPSSHAAVTWGGNTSCSNYSSMDDDISPAISIGFSFTYGSTAYSQVYVQTNGRLTFGSNSYCKVKSISSSSLTNTMAATNGMDLDFRAGSCPAATCYVRYATIGSSPNRQFVVSFVNAADYYDSSQKYNFQIILNEDGSFVYQYGSIASSVTAAWETTQSDYATVSNQSSSSARRFYQDTSTATPLAWYKLDESSWSANSIPDTAGSNTGTQVGSLTAGATGKICSGATVPANTGSGSSSAIGTPFTLGSHATLKSAGTIDFWWKPSLASGSKAQLLDATISSGKYFYLARKSDNTLYFYLYDSNGSSRAVSGSSSYKVGTAGTWYHIAVTWDFNAQQAAIYVNGVVAGSNTLTSGRTISNTIGSLYVGDNRSTYIQSNGTYYSAAGIFDEVKVYDRALSAYQVNVDKNASHTCTGSLHHVRIEHDGSASTCAAEDITLRACANSDCSAVYTGGVSGITLTSSGSGNTWTNNPATITVGADSAIATLSRTATGAVTLGLSGSYATSPNQMDCKNTSSGLVNSSTACSLTFSSGFSFDVPNHAAGEAQTVSITTCDASYANQAKPLKFSLAYLDPSTGTKGGVVAALPPADVGTDVGANCSNSANVSTSVPNSAQISPTFNSAVKPAARFSFCYQDVGKATLNVQDDAGTITGTDVFIAKPYAFTFGSFSPANPGASDANGSAFVAAGSAFAATVTAVTKQNTAAPNFGQETTPEGVTLTALLVAPSGGDAGTLSCKGSSSDCVLNGSAFKDINNVPQGAAVVSDFAWTEVGIMKIEPHITSALGTGAGYLNSGDVAASLSGNIGRFKPAYFKLTSASLTSVNRTVATCDALANIADLTTSITSGSKSLQVTDATPFSAGDTVLVVGAGAGGGDLITTVGSVDTANDILTLASAASATVVNGATFQQRAWSYMGESLGLAFGVNAYNATNNQVSNYTGSFAKLTAGNATGSGDDSWGLSIVGQNAYGSSGCRVTFGSGPNFTTSFNGSCPSSPAYPLNSSAARVVLSNPAVDWADGVGSLSANVVLNPILAAGLPADGPFTTLGLGVMLQDADGVTMQSAAKNLDTDATTGYDRVRIGLANVRQGRLRLSNAYGSERLNLSIPSVIQSYDSVSGWVTQTADVCSTTGGPTLVSPQGLVSAASYNSPAVTGDVGLSLSAPGSPGYIDVSFGSLPSFLMYPWKSAALSGATARATFGIFKGSDRTIFRRERY